MHTFKLLNPCNPTQPLKTTQDFTPTEHWAAYIEPTTGYGIGVFTPICDGMTSYRVGEWAAASP